MVKTPDNVLRICRNCKHWTSYDSQAGDCEHPEIRNKVICIALPCHENPEPQWAQSVGYRTDPRFGCNLFEPYVRESGAGAAAGTDLSVRVQPGEERFREDVVAELNELLAEAGVKEIAIEETMSERSRKAIEWAGHHNIPTRIADQTSEEDVILM